MMRCVVVARILNLLAPLDKRKYFSFSFVNMPLPPSCALVTEIRVRFVCVILYTL